MEKYMQLLNSIYSVSGHLVYEMESEMPDYKMIQILYMIQRDNCNQKMLANRLGMTEPALSMKLKLIEKQELIFKKKNGKDKRNYILALTQKGIEKLNDGLVQSRNKAEQLLSGLSEEQKNQLLYLLDKIGN